MRDVTTCRQAGPAQSHQHTRPLVDGHAPAAGTL